MLARSDSRKSEPFWHSSAENLRFQDFQGSPRTLARPASCSSGLHEGDARDGARDPWKSWNVRWSRSGGHGKAVLCEPD